MRLKTSNIVICFIVKDKELLTGEVIMLSDQSCQILAKILSKTRNI
jgi:hypothetical protein